MAEGISAKVGELNLALIERSEQKKCLSEWMSQLSAHLHTVPITQLIIPGSHATLAIECDAQTDLDFSPYNPQLIKSINSLPKYPIFNRLRADLKEVWKRWASRQEVSVYQQMALGVRYLDLRVAMCRGRLFGEHGLYSRPFRDYLADIDLFLQNHVREVIIMHFQQVNNLNLQDLGNLFYIIRNLFGEKLCPVLDTSLLTLKNMWQLKYQIILVFPQQYMDDFTDECRRFVWFDSLIQGDYPKATIMKTLLHYMKEECQHRLSRRDITRFMVTQLVVTPEQDVVFKETDGCMNALCAETVSPSLSKSIRPLNGLNIVSFDFVGQSDLAQKIVDLNM